MLPGRIADAMMWWQDERLNGGMTISKGKPKKLEDEPDVVSLRLPRLLREEFWDWSRGSTKRIPHTVAWSHTVDIVLRNDGTMNEQFLQNFAETFDYWRADGSTCLKHLPSVVTGLNVIVCPREVQNTWLTAEAAP